MYATRGTQEIIRMHIFIWAIWPGFSQIPDDKNPYLRFHTITLSGRSIAALPGANHTVPVVSYHRQRQSQLGVFRRHHHL